MNINKLNEDFSATGQIGPDDLAQLFEQGFRGVICNRPDDEEPGQPSYETIEAAARAAGLDIRYVPIFHHGVTIDDVEAFATALRELSGPVLAYCRSGARSAGVYGLVQQHFPD